MGRSPWVAGFCAICVICGCRRARRQGAGNESAAKSAHSKWAAHAILAGWEFSGGCVPRPRRVPGCGVIADFRETNPICRTSLPSKAL